jgi:prepilin-type N-terminal cleavage/methylation domain-containing protein
MLRALRFHPATRPERGYTLLELSVSLTILAVLLTGGLTLFGKADDSKKLRITNERIAIIQNALGDYARTNQSLPCPAPGNTLESSATFGVATAMPTVFTPSTTMALTLDATAQTATLTDTTTNPFDGITGGTQLAVSGFATAANNGLFTVNSKTSTSVIVLPLVTGMAAATAAAAVTNPITIIAHECKAATDQTGMVPVRTLGLSDDLAYDAWGRKFIYRIGAGMGSSTDFQSNSFMGDLRIIDINGNEKTDIEKPAPNNMGAAYVLISHGPNGLGAWWFRNQTGTYTAPTGRELENTNHTVNKIYVQNERTSKINGTDASFDDIVVYQRKSDLLPQVKATSPIRISGTICSNAQAIADGGEASVSATDLLSLFRTANTNRDTALADQIYLTARAMKTLCNNQSSVCAFTPLSVQPASLKLWLDAADIYGNGNLPEDKAPIAQWYDKSGNGYHAIQATSANQPLFRGMGTNGKPSVFFNNASSHFMTVSSAALLAALKTNPGTVTVFIVSSTDNPTSDTSILTLGTAAASRFNISLPRATGGSKAFWDYGNSTTATGEVSFAWGGTASTPNVWSFYADSVAGKMAIYKDGVSVITTASGKSPTIAAAAGTLDIARFTAPSTAYWQGNVSEIIIYNTNLSDTERQAVENYLGLKWKMQISSTAAVCPDGYVQ